MFDYSPSPKPQHVRRKAKRAQLTEFPNKTRIAIGERDNWSCVRCGGVANHIHHIRFRSELSEDVAHKRNGCCVCFKCHDYAHSGREGRQWFLDWQQKYLDENGDKIILPFSDLF